MENDLRRIRSVADYQFGEGVGIKLFPENVQISHSKTTGRIRYIHLGGERLATLRPTDGLLSLSILAAKSILESPEILKCIVRVRDDIAKFVSEGSDVFAAHVVDAHEEIRPRDEVIIVNESNQFLAIGRSLLSSSEMKAFKIGVAVKVRHGSRHKS